MFQTLIPSRLLPVPTTSTKAASTRCYVETIHPLSSIPPINFLDLQLLPPAPTRQSPRPLHYQGSGPLQQVGSLSAPSIFTHLSNTPSVPTRSLDSIANSSLSPSRPPSIPPSIHPMRSAYRNVHVGTTSRRIHSHTNVTAATVGSRDPSCWADTDGAFAVQVLGLEGWYVRWASRRCIMPWLGRIGWRTW